MLGLCFDGIISNHGFRIFIGYIGIDIFETVLTTEQLLLVGRPIEESISVDGAWNTSTGVVEYQGVHTKTKELIFKVGPLEDGTNNIY